MNQVSSSLFETIEYYKTRQEFVQACRIIENAIVRCPDDYRLYEELGDILLYAGDVKRAKNAIEYAQMLLPNSPTGLYLRGYLATLEEDFATAVTYLEQSNALCPNNAEVLRNLGWSYTMMGQIRKGIVLLQRALQLNPEDYLIIEDLGMAFLSDGNTNEARRLLKKIGKEHKIEEVG